MVVDAKVDDRVGEPPVAGILLDDEERRRLLAAPIATGRLRRGEALEQALRESTVACLERLGERVDRRPRDEDVSLRGVPGTRPPAGPLEAAGAGVARADALAVDHSDLTLLAAVVGLGQRRDHLLRGAALPQERESLGPVTRVRVGLRGDRADLCLGPGHDRADGEKLRLDGDSPLLRRDIAGDDRVRRDRAVPRSGAGTPGVSHRSTRSDRARAARVRSGVRRPTPPPGARALP